MKMFKTILFTLVFSSLISFNAHSAGGSGAVLDKAHMNMTDKAALRDGAKVFVNYCLSCHSASYSRYSHVAEDLEIPLFRLKENLMFTTDKEGDLMETTMPAKDSKAWFGVTPPDLTLVARVRGSDWLYTYLRAFYQDEKSPSGWNNSLFENVAMPHALYELQGVQQLMGKMTADEMHDMEESHVEGSGDGAGSDMPHDLSIVGNAKFELVHPGKLTPEEFDVAMLNLTAFLTYLGEPAQLKRHSMGVYTIAFLIILTLLCYLLKLEYWRDIH